MSAPVDHVRERQALEAQLASLAGTGEDVTAIIQRLIELAAPGDVLILAGSDA